MLGALTHRTPFQAISVEGIRETRTNSNRPESTSTAGLRCQDGFSVSLLNHFKVQLCPQSLGKGLDGRGSWRQDAVGPRVWGGLHSMVTASHTHDVPINSSASGPCSQPTQQHPSPTGP